MLIEAKPHGSAIALVFVFALSLVFVLVSCVRQYGMHGKPSRVDYSIATDDQQLAHGNLRGAEGGLMVTPFDNRALNDTKGGTKDAASSANTDLVIWP